MKPERALDSKSWLKTVFNSAPNLDVEFARLSIQNFEISRLTAMAIVFIEYAQLIAQAILFNPSLYNDSEYSDDTFVRVAVFLVKIFNPGHFFKQNKTGAFVVIVLIATILITLFKLLLLGYIVYIAKNKLPGSCALINLWRWIFRLQSKVIYFFISSFWINTIFLIKNNSFDVFGIGKTGTIAIGSVIIAIEFILSAALQLRYFYILPVGKDLFSAKSNNFGIITLLQKLLIQIFFATLPTNTLQTAWIMSVFNLCFSILRSAQFYKKLPLYQIRALVFEGGLLAAVLSINSVCLMQAIMRSLHAERNSILFTFIAWIIISILAVKVSFGFLKKKIVHILNDKNPEFFVHKISFIKELQKLHQMPNDSTPKYDWYYFLNTTVNTNLQKIFYTTADENNNSSDFDNKLILSHLQHLSDLFPRDNFIKLYLAYFYGFKLKYFGNAIRCIKESNLENHTNNNIRLTAFLLIIKIQEISRNVGKEQQKTKINLNTYVDSLAIVNRLEERIFSQTDQQIQLYKEITSETPNLANIFNHAQSIKALRQRIERKINYILKDTPEANITPLMLYAEYQLRINHSMKEYLYFQKLYQKKFQKYTKYFDKDGLDEHNAYQQTTAFLVLDTSKQDNGKILYCSKSIEDIYGGSSQLYIGTNIAAYTLPSLRGSVAHLRASMSTTGNRSLFQSIIETYGYHQKGYLVPMNALFEIFPIMTEGLYFMLMIRSYSISNDILMVRENGDIESPTQNIAERLGLPSVLSTITNIKSLSKELARINQAFNLVNSLDQQKSQSTSSQPLANSFKEIHDGGGPMVTGKGSQPTLTFSPLVGATTTNSHFAFEDEAREIVKVYSGEGGIIELTSLKDPSKPGVSYFCTIQPFRTSLKVISLKEMNTQKNEDSDEIQFTQPESKESQEEFPNSNADFEFEDEKQAGWIPLDTLNPHKIRQPTRETLGPTAAGETFPTMEDHLLSPKSNHFLLTPRSPTNRSSAKIPRHIKKDPQNIIIPEKAISMASSQVSINSKKQKTEEAFQVALAVKQYPRSWFCLFFMFYFGIAAIFGIQLSSKIFLEDDFSNFILKKQILTDAQSRNYYLLSSQIGLQLAIDYESGRVSLSDFGMLAALGGRLFSNAKSMVMELEIYNNNILISSNLLEKSIQKTLFDQNVRIFDSENDQDSLMLNTIQATNSIIETALKIFTYLAQNKLDLAQSEMSVFTKNALNDLIIETENITSIFLASLANQTNNILDLLRTFLIVILVWVSCVILSFALIIRRLYQEENNNLLAVTKLNTQFIQKTLQDMISFQEKLQGSKKEISENNSSDKSNNTKTDLKDSNTRQAPPKKPNSSGTQKKYIVYFARLLSISVTVAVLAVINSIIIRNSLNSLQEQQAFLQFTYGTKVNAALSLISFMELFSSNNESRIKHVDPLTEVETQIQVIQNVRIEALKDLTANQDDFMTPEFKIVVLGDACSLIESPYSALFCDIMSAYGKSSGLIYLMNTLEDILIDKRNQYIASNKTAEVLKKIQFEQIDLVTSVFQLLSIECDLFSVSLDEGITRILNNAQRNRNWIFGAFTFQLVTQGFIFWIMVLSRLKEANNQFKNVLRTFPSRLVLSNFLLKIFLVNTSKGFLDLAIKSDL